MRTYDMRLLSCVGLLGHATFDGRRTGRLAVTVLSLCRTTEAVDQKFKLIQGRRSRPWVIRKIHRTLFLRPCGWIAANPAVLFCGAVQRRLIRWPAMNRREFLALVALTPALTGTSCRQLSTVSGRGASRVGRFF